MKLIPTGRTWMLPFNPEKRVYSVWVVSVVKLNPTVQYKSPLASWHTQSLSSSVRPLEGGVQLPQMGISRILVAHYLGYSDTT